MLKDLDIFSLQKKTLRRDMIVIFNYLNDCHIVFWICFHLFQKVRLELMGWNFKNVEKWNIMKNVLTLRAHEVFFHFAAGFQKRLDSHLPGMVQWIQQFAGGCTRWSLRCLPTRWFYNHNTGRRLGVLLNSKSSFTSLHHFACYGMLASFVEL